VISKIKLKNFRSHSETELELSPNVNIICGDNDLGKSSILRAINWLAFNKPTGNSFIKHGKKNCYVSVELDNFGITRNKNRKGDNSYTLYKDGKEDNKFLTVGQSVPEEIKNILKIEEINIQNQHDKTFLLSESSGYISRYLNNLVGLDIIDNSLKKANSEIRTINSEIKKEEERQAKLNKEKESVGPLLEQESLYKQIVINQKEYDKLDNDELKLTNLINEINIINNNLLQYGNIEKANILYKTISKNIIKLNSCKEKERKLNGIINNLNEIENNLNNMNIKKANKLYNSINKYISDLRDFEITEIELTKNINSFNIIHSEIVSLGKTIDKNKKEFKTKFPQECPLCGANTKEIVI
jgi:DNA repair protein SbcC/Rad50